MAIKLEKIQTGIDSEFYVADELCRLGYNVKGIHSSASLCWTVYKTKITDDIFLLVNLHVDYPKRNENSLP